MNYTESCLREEEHNLYPLECQPSAGKMFPAKITKMLFTRNISNWVISSSENFFLKSECSFTKYVSSCPYTKYFYLRYQPVCVIKDTNFSSLSYTIERRKKKYAVSGKVERS